jgi:hypothetical protein
MDVLAALLPPVVAAVAFIAIARAAIRHTDGRNRAESDDADDHSEQTK